MSSFRLDPTGEPPAPRMGSVKCSWPKFAIALGLLSSWAWAGPPQEDGGQTQRRFFAIPEARDARTLAERAQDHIAAQRWTNALADLQRLIEEHGGDVLPADMAEGNERSLFAVYPGAAEWAERTLLNLSAEGQRLYRERYEAQARTALDVARTRAERRALVEVARRWPLTSAAQEAWWALGDLEFEEGYLQEALAAWARARELDPNAAGAASAADKRMLPARRILAEQETPETAPGSRTPGLPHHDSDSWSLEGLDLDPFRAGGGLYHFNLMPVLVGEKVLLSTTMRLYSIDAFTGDLIWQQGPVEGWDALDSREQGDLFEGLARERLLSWPAVGGSVVVAAMQIPYSRDQNDHWQGIDIMAAIPERRLFAYDLESGRPLWDHAPEFVSGIEGGLDLDGVSRRFEERMLVAAPPRIVGSRILVPCYQMQGRIDYHVACYELRTGERLWSTSLVSGQRERNMFGRAQEEFVASPLAVSGDTVIAQTELGTVAALDLATGRILWESLYEQIPLPKTHNYNAPQREQKWREAAPVIVGNVVVSTPTDSEHLIAFELETGTVLWSYREQFLRSSKARHYALIGADERTVYLDGERVSALEKAGGLGKAHPPFQRRWSFPIEEGRARTHRPRAVLADDVLVVPTKDERIVLDRKSGDPRRLESGAWSFSESGNLALGDGMMFTLSQKRLTAFFDWDSLLARKRANLAKFPDDPEAALATAELAARRGLSLHERGDPKAALDYLGEARTILETRVEGNEDPDRRLSGSLFEVLSSEAEVRTGLAQSPQALEALRRARLYVRNREDLRDVLLHEEALLRHGGLADRLTTLAELEQRCADLPLPARILEGSADWLIGEALLDETELEGWNEALLPVGLWVLLTRADARARAADRSGALVDLHGALARYGELAISEGLRVGSIVRRRIGRRLELDGPDDYAVFEERATELFQEAMTANDPKLLRTVADLYPHSQAAIRANRARLDWAFRAQDAETVARIVGEAIQNPQTQKKESALLLLRLGSLLADAGNEPFYEGLLAFLVERFPALRSDIEAHGRRTLNEIYKERVASDPAPQVPEPGFDERAGYASSYLGLFLYLGQLAPERWSQEQAPSTIHVYARNRELFGFASTDPTEVSWQARRIPFDLERETSTVSESRVICGGSAAEGERLLAYDRQGELVWSHDLGEQVLSSVRCFGGIVVALASSPKKSSDRLFAFDAHLGTPLWQLPIRRTGARWEEPIQGEPGDGVLVLFGLRWGKPTVALIVDLYRGEVRSRFELGHTESKVAESAWIDGGKIWIPTFTRTRDLSSGVTGYDLATGEAVSNVEFSDSEELYAVVESGGENYLITVPDSVESQPRNGGIYQLDPDHGLQRTVFEMRAGDEPMGLQEKARTRLPSPYVFVYSRRSTGKTTPIQAIHLPFQRRWVHHLPVSYDELYQRSLPMPVVSEDCVAIAYVTRHPTSRGPDEARLEFVDRNTGLQRDRRNLHDDFSGSDLELRGLGDALFVVGQRPHRTGNRLEIFQEVR